MSGAVNMHERELDVIPHLEAVSGFVHQSMMDSKWETAVKEWSVLRKVYPNEPDVWIKAGLCHLKLGEISLARELANESIQRFPGNLEGFILLVDVLIRGGDKEAAHDMVSLAREKFSKRALVYIKSSEVALFLGDVSESEYYNEIARTISPGNVRSWIQYAELAMEQELWELSLSRWAEVRERFPDNPVGFTRAAIAAENLEDKKLALLLRSARTYGNEWLTDVLSSDTSPLRDMSEYNSRSNFAELIWTKAWLNLKSEAEKTYLSYLWWIIEPLLYMAVFYTVFGVFLNKGGDGFVAFLLVGLVPFQWFAKTVMQTSNSILAGRGLMYNVRLSAIFFPLVGVLQQLSKQFFVFFMLFLFLVLYGVYPELQWLGLVPVILCQLIFIVAISCFLAMVIPFLRDIGNLVPFGVQFSLFVSGVFYPLDAIPENWQQIFLLNPIANLLYQYRLVLIEGGWPDWYKLGEVFLISFVGMLLVIFLYRRLYSVFPRVVLE